MRSVALQLVYLRFPPDLPHRSRRMRRATLPVSPLSSRLSPPASLPKATLTPPVTSILVLPPVSRLLLLAPPQRLRTMRLATFPTVSLPLLRSPLESLPRSQLTELATFPLVLRLAHRLGLLRLTRTLRFPLTLLATSSPLVRPLGYLLSPLASRRRSRSTRRAVFLPRLLAPP